MLHSTPLFKKTYFIPAMGWLIIFILLIFDLNSTIFIFINSLSKYTGEWIWPVITIFGDPVVLVCIGLCFIQIQAKIAISILPALIMGLIIVFALKWSIDIPRPGLVFEKSQFILLGIPPISPAFPSGHTTGIFTLATLVICFSKKPLIVVFSLIIACLVAISRIMVGAHWPLDVAGGMILGWGIALFTVHLTQNFVFDKKIHKTLLFILILSSIALMFKPTDFPNTFLVQIIIAFCGIFIGIKNLNEWPEKIL